jgi:hypothetical protein
VQPAEVHDRRSRPVRAWAAAPESELTQLKLTRQNSGKSGAAAADELGSRASGGRQQQAREEAGRIRNGQGLTVKICGRSDALQADGGRRERALNFFE